jgi:hypothetical protein
MFERSWFLLATFASTGALALGCIEGQSPAEDRETSSVASAPPVATASTPATESEGTLMKRLLATTEAVGPDAEVKYQAALAEFRASAQPLGALEAHYASLPLRARSERWKAVYLMGKLPAPEAVGMLEQIAVGKMKAAPPAQAEPLAPEEDPTDLPIEREAATAIALRAADGEAVAARALNTVFNQSTPEVARAAALELFAAGKLAPAHRALLEGRGVRIAFRRLRADEEASLFKLSPEARATNKKPMLTPPALEVTK